MVSHPVVDTFLFLIDPKGNMREISEEILCDEHCPVKIDEKLSYIALSPAFSQILYNERGCLDESNQKEGKIVSFVGKTALPCVCEVSNADKAKSRNSFIEPNGFQWQSLYMVLLSNQMVLVVPVRNG